jgi:large subunit ribosomal protein L23
MGSNNQYAFKVDINATKLQIKHAVEGYFSVNVESVNVIKVKGKTKRSRFRIRKKSDWKKAYVRLAEGESIEVGIE